VIIGRISQWKPCGNGIAPSIPEFLIRKTATAGCRHLTAPAKSESEEAIMADEAKKPDHLKVVPEETVPEEILTEEEKKQLDEEEAEFRALRRDTPGVKGASDAGMLTISVRRQPSPKSVFYRTHPTFRPVVPMVSIEVGMDKHFIAVMPDMVAPLVSIGIAVADHTLYLILTELGGLQIIPVRGQNADGEQNQWDETKEQALIKGINGWYRMYPDIPNGAFMAFPAPIGTKGEPKWPNIKHARIMRLAFKDKGRLIDSIDHILVKKWDGRAKA
jgi:hypothetical protein